MKINGKVVKNNEYLTFSQLENLEKKYDSIERQIEKKFPVSVSYERSGASEAAYFSIEREDEECLEISIRNHTNSYSNAELIWISNYENWTALKKEIFSIIEQFISGTYVTQMERLSL